MIMPLNFLFFYPPFYFFVCCFECLFDLATWLVYFGPLFESFCTNSSSLFPPLEFKREAQVMDPSKWLIKSKKNRHTPFRNSEKRVNSVKKHYFFVLKSGQKFW